ncbi:MAG: exonuclease domain-containing protein [Burkholderiales bacterium]|nr:exonuclease domain-containing protein [Burkholderiales bacterium]
MTLARKRWLWTAVSFGALLALLAAVALVVASALAPAERERLSAALAERAPALAFVALVLAFACAGVVKWLFDEYVVAIRGLAEQTHVLVGANEALRVRTDGAREVAEAAAAINRLADAWRDLKRDAERRAQEAAARLEEERNRLAALMAELADGVLVCNAEGRILLYNEQARALFAGAAPVGLGRSVFGLLDRAQIAHALEKLARLARPGEAPPVTRFVAAVGAGRLLRVRAAPFGAAGGGMAGFVLSLEDVTGEAGREGARRALLDSLAASLRAPVANLRAAAENLRAYPDMAPEDRARFHAIVAEESRVLSDRLNAALRRYAEALKAGIELEDMRVADLLEVARRRIESALAVDVALEEIPDDLWVRADSFALVQALAFVVGRLNQDYAVRRVRLAARAEGGHVALDLDWDGAIVASDALALWETEPMQTGAERTPLTLRDVLERHGGEIWPQRAGPAGMRRGGFRWLLPAGEPAPARAVSASARSASRPEYYDFDLFRPNDASRALAERPLAELAYTVFDTETTGLEPSAGDEIVSIGAVRIVNGRLLRSEVFEALVNPRRPMSREAVKIHGIDAATLAGQPTIEQVLPAFRRFCEDTVLVAHNAAFDMRFLELKEQASGVAFDQPVLDTLLLSAAVHPAQSDHRLEAIAERLGVPVLGRHTALGDALLTAEIFLRLIPLLAERGIVTLGAALAASRETWYARVRY